MAIFGIHRRRKAQPAEEIPATGFRRDPFLAVPHRNPLAQGREDSRGNIQIRMRPQPGRDWRSRLACRLGFHRDVRVDLDAHGTFYWNQVNGECDLREIEKRIRKQFSLETDDSRMATLAFTKSLMLRHLILLDIGKEQADDS